MTRKRKDLNRLLVEGKQDLLAIAYLLDHHIVWGDRKDECVDGSIEYDGVEMLLRPGEIETVLQEPDLQAVGIAVDADSNGKRRWLDVRARCIEAFPHLPEQLPREGLISVNESGLRLGVWLFPDNIAIGMLETFAIGLIPPSESSVFQFVVESVAEATRRGARFKKLHQAKAEIHTWLAWQDPPDLQLHQAVLARVLDPASPFALPFVEWFIKLFQLDDLRRPVTP